MVLFIRLQSSKIVPLGIEGYLVNKMHQWTRKLLALGYSSTSGTFGTDYGVLVD